MGLKENIKMYRELLDMTQDELAAKLGYKSRSSINKIELGLSDIPQSKITAFAKALNVTPSQLMGWEKEAPAANKDDEQLVEMFSKLNKQDRDYILKFMRSLADSDSQKVE